MGFRELENEETKTPFLVPLNSKSEVGRLPLLLSSLAVLKFLFLSEGHLRIEKRKKERHLAREKKYRISIDPKPSPFLVSLVGWSQCGRRSYFPPLSVAFPSVIAIFPFLLR